jgi:hypothetical protein
MLLYDNRIKVWQDFGLYKFFLVYISFLFVKKVQLYDNTWKMFYKMMCVWEIEKWGLT